MSVMKNWKKWLVAVTFVAVIASIILYSISDTKKNNGREERVFYYQWRTPEPYHNERDMVEQEQDPDKKASLQKILEEGIKKGEDPCMLRCRMLSDPIL
jgi:hypothetical protein